MTVTHAAAFIAVPLVYCPMRSRRLMRSSMKTRTTGSSTPFATCERYMTGISGMPRRKWRSFTRTTFAPEVSTICRSRSTWPTQNEGSDGSRRPGTRRSTGTRSRTAAGSSDSTSRQRAVSRKDSTRPRRMRSAVTAGKVSARVTARSSRRPTALPSGSRTARPVPTARRRTAAASGALGIAPLLLLHLLLFCLQVLELVLRARVLALELLFLVLDFLLLLLDRRETLLDLPERPVDVADRLLAMTPVVFGGGLEMRLRRLEILP